MTRIVSTPELVNTLRSTLRAEVSASAGSNSVVSRAEQETLPDALLRDAAEAVRAAGGKGTWVSTDALVAAASDSIERVLGLVNQPSGPGLSRVSADEVRAAHALNPEAGHRIARAYELICGRHIDLSGVTPNPPPPAQAGPVALSGLTSSQPLSPPAILRINGSTTLEIKGGAPSPVDIDLVIDGTPVHLSFPPQHRSSQGNIGGPDARDIVEKLRASLSSHDVRVTSFEAMHLTAEVWPKGTAPGPAEPLYGAASFIGGGPALPTSGPYPILEMTGPKAVRCDHGGVTLPAGTQVRFQLDNKEYLATAGTSENTGDLFRQLKGQMEADGHTVDVRDYAGPGLVSLRVVS